jgi:RND superfamily putative drug exporter
LRLGQPAVDAPKDAAVVQTMAAIQRAFPQAPAPAEVVVTGQDVTGPKVLAAVDQLRARAAAGGAIHDPVTSTVIGGGRALVVDVPLAGNGTDTASDNALLTLRNQLLPDTLGKVPGVSYAVTGDTASTYDIIQTEDASLPVVFGFVAVLAFVLLLGPHALPLVPLPRPVHRLRRRRGRLQEHRRPTDGADANIALRCAKASSQREAICNTPHTQTRTA